MRCFFKLASFSSLINIVSITSHLSHCCLELWITRFNCIQQVTNFSKLCWQLAMNTINYRCLQLLISMAMLCTKDVLKERCWSLSTWQYEGVMHCHLCIPLVVTCMLWNGLMDVAYWVLRVASSNAKRG